MICDHGQMLSRSKCFLVTTFRLLSAYCDAALWAASVDAIRRDLSAESAFTSADLLFDQTAGSTNPVSITTAADARRSIDHVLSLAPHQSSLLAGLALRFPSAGVNALEALKMSCYTGPSEQNAIPLRLRTDARAARFDHIQMREFASRELRVLVKARQNSAMAEAYNMASPAGKHFIEQSVGDTDPSVVNALRAVSGPRQSLSN